MNRPLDLPLSIVDVENCNVSTNPSFDTVLQARLSRRSVLRGGFGSAATAVLGSFGVAACGGGGGDDAEVALTSTTVTRLSFTAVPKSTADVLSVPAGYTASIIFALGDPLTAATPAYKNDGTDTDFDNRAGDHHDGMEYFGLSDDGTRADPKGSNRGLLVMNHEALTDNFLHVAGASARPRPAAQSDKEIPAHGISVVEVNKGTAGRFAYAQSSAYNRRITPLTPMEIGGPARGSALMKTQHAPAGTACRGTINNCGTGYTPWGTFLTGEENWAGYFTRSATDNVARGNDKSVASLNRYGRSQGAASRHGWETSGAADKYLRWDISKRGVSIDGSDDYRNELNTFGYIVEVDPYNKTSAIKKRTALGRFAHESAAFGKPVVGKPLAVYMGDDSRGEYIYKFVSTATWAEADYSSSSRIATGDKYLDSGKLYVAKFNADGTGNWVELNITNSAISGYAVYAFADQADVLVNARLAADAVGATKMDRPEWCAVHPDTGEIYYTLTNNSNRKVEPVGSGQQALDAANPRAYSDAFGTGAPGAPGNVNGHIIRMGETGGESAAATFAWDVYLFGAQADADASRVNISSLTAEQDFSSPDGLWFSPTTKLAWIQTDDGAYTDVSNCMMLVGIPGKVGDGGEKTLSYTKTDGSTMTITTRAGKAPTTDTLKRFLVGPADCEITGAAETPDGKTLFVNIQHPGETISAANVSDPARYLSHWPGNSGYGNGGAVARPRSATIAVTKNDNGIVGA